MGIRSRRIVRSVAPPRRSMLSETVGQDDPVYCGFPEPMEGVPVSAIVAEGLVKIYKSRKSEVRALDGVDLTVEEGTVLGLLGPNGAVDENLTGCSRLPSGIPPAR